MTDTMVDRLRFAWKQDNEEFRKWHVQMQGDGALMQELVELADQKRVSITTYSKASHGEVGSSAFPTMYDFFHNPDDGNHVRVKPLESF
ncbi:MAG TPA: hypothetical protein VHF01_00920 [Candidatus Acidoferrum sp.]|nr:hypothetical protein [Candidatus Acidoferrum sp.]